MNFKSLSNSDLAAELAARFIGVPNEDAGLALEAASRLAVWDVPVEQIAEVRRKRAEARRESAPLRRKRVHL